MERNHYAILGVGETASHDELQLAYRRLVPLYHPDSSGADTAAQFREVQAAWDTLGDAQRRREYDARRARARHPAKLVSPTPLHPTMKPDIMGLARPSQLGRTEWAGTDAVLHLELLLNAADVAAGGRLPMDLPPLVPCGSCGGAGSHSLSWCTNCGGPGYHLSAERFILQVPPGLRHGQVMQIPLHGWELCHRVLILHVRVNSRPAASWPDY
jgi:hypothetical protein